MNVFELNVAITPIVSAIAGSVSGRAHGTSWTIIGACLGLAIGAALVFLDIYLFRLIFKYPKKPSPTQRFAGNTVVIMAILSPIIAIGCSALVVKLLHG